MRLLSLRISIPLFAAFLLSLPVAAQDNKPLNLGGYQIQGSVTTGYRFTSIKGRREKYLELFNLQSGPRLMDFNLSGRATDGANRFADDFSLTLSGLGGDPFPAAQFSVRKSGLYDLRVSFRQSYYYWDRNDDATLPSGLHGLTSNHNWATVRKMGSADFTLHATNNLRFGFECSRNSRNGDTESTRSLDYFGSSSTWGSFARANPYVVDAPVDELTNRVTGRIDYTHKDWNYHYRIGYQIFDSTMRATGLVSPERSINIDDPTTAAELLQSLSWTDSRTLRSPISEFSYTGKLKPWADLHGDYIFYRYRGPASLDESFNGVARTNTGGTADAPYSVSTSGRAEVSEPDQVVDQGATFKVNEWWNILADYRYSNTSVSSDATFQSVNTGVSATGSVAEHWHLRSHQADLNFELIPRPGLTVTTGLRFLNRDIEALDNGVLDPTRSKNINTVWPTASVYYAPSTLFSIRGDFSSITNGTSYTRISPHTDIGTRFVVRYRPIEKLQIEDNVQVRNRQFLDTSFHNTTRANSIVATYELDPKFSIFAGLTYESFFATDAVTFLRGTPPLNVVWRDQTINRTWQGGFTAKPLPRFGVSFSGNFLRTTGRGEITDELPLYGPETFPFATGTVYYDFPAIGRLSIDLQRTYYIEEIVTGNNFSANLLTIRWTRDF